MEASAGRMAAVAELAAVSAGTAAEAGELPQAPIRLPQTPLYTQLAGGVMVERATPGALPLSIDEAIERGLQHNLRISCSDLRTRGRAWPGAQVKNNLLPSMTAEAKTSAQQINLAAMGFNREISLPGLIHGDFPRS